MTAEPTIKSAPAAAPVTLVARRGLLARAGAAVPWLLALACLLFAYWPTLESMALRWYGDQQYSHGFLVPVFALVILWHRRDVMPASSSWSWWGAVVLLVVLALRFVAAYIWFQPLDAFSLLPALLGVCLLLGGWPVARWTWPAIAFLAFMLPLPYQVESALSQPLRRLATQASTFLLQTLGFPAVSEGNVIYVEEVTLGVLDACNGLGMLMTFFALSTAMAMIIERHWTDRLFLVASAIPIALIVNILRIVVTAIVTLWDGREMGKLTHDHSAIPMMVTALALLGLEVWLLNRLLVEVGDTMPLESRTFNPLLLGAPQPVHAVEHAATPRLEQKNDT